MIWLDRHRTSILEHGGPTVMLAPLGYGTTELIASLDRRQAPLVWLELSEPDQDDPVAQGNRLVDAVKQALGSPVLPMGLPFQYGIHFLKSNLALLGPFTFALSGAEHGQGMAEALLELDGGDNRAVLVFADEIPDIALPYRTRLLDRSQLRLAEDEADELVAGRLSPEEVATLLRQTDGAYLDFLSALHDRFGLPPPTRPSPSGAHLPPGREVLVEPELLLEVLIEKERWIEALELAASHLLERAPGVLAHAGHVFHEHGLHQRLDTILSGIPIEFSDETVLRWRLVAASRLGEVAGIRSEIEAYLAEFPAPELRASYAATLRDPDEREAEARRAFEAAKTPLTLFQYGRMMRSLPRGAELLRQSIELAETYGRPYEVARNAGALAAQLTHLGRYREAAHWGEWALQFFDRHELADGQRRLKLLNDWAYNCLLIGNTVGLAQPLKEAEPHLDLAYPSLARLFRSTLGDFHMVAGQPGEALHYYRENLETSPRLELGKATLEMGRALLELGEPQAALELAERAFVLTKDDPYTYHLPAILACGTALSLTEPARARKLLSDLGEDGMPAYHRARAALYLAYLDHAAGEVQAARLRLEQVHKVLGELALSGLRLLSGPESAFQPLWRLVLGQEENLHLKLLGQPEVWHQGERIDLQPQWLEIAAILAFSGGESGLTLDRLHLELLGDRGTPANLKAALSRLRRKLPISRHPYRFDTPLSSDVEQLETLLKEGRVHEALSIYAGPLLPDSEAPAIRSKGEQLEASLRRAVLASNDPDCVVQLAEVLGDDLELWTTAREMLSPQDPRAPLVRARIDQVLLEWDR